MLEAVQSLFWQIGTSPFKLYGIFFWVFLHYLSSKDCTLAYYQYIIDILLLLNMHFIALGKYLCKSKYFDTPLQGCELTFWVYSTSGPNVQPQSCVITSRWTKERNVCVCVVFQASSLSWMARRSGETTETEKWQTVRSFRWANPFVF